MTFHRILLLNRNHIGDCLFTTPAIRALRTAYPEAVLVAAVPPVNHDLLAHNPCLSEVLVRPPQGVSQQLRLLREIRRRRFDLVISFQEKSFFYAALARLSGARLTVSLQHWRTRPFYQRIVPVVPGRHEVEKYHAIAQAALLPVQRRSTGAASGKRSDGVGEGARGREGQNPSLPLPGRPLAPSPRPPVTSAPGAMELHVSREHRARAGALLAEIGVDEDTVLVGINPGATMDVKRWPPERFAAVGRELVSRHAVKVLVLGGPGDEKRAATIADAVPGAVTVAGKTRLGETAALLRRCQLLISGDTGPLHMAVAVGTPVVGLFGPTNPTKYGPWSERGAGGRATVLRHAKPCTLCDRPCIHSISIDECLAAAESWLNPSETESRDPVAGMTA